MKLCYITFERTTNGLHFKYLMSFHPCYRQESKRHQSLACITNANIEIKQYCKLRTFFARATNRYRPHALIPHVGIKNAINRKSALLKCNHAKQNTPYVMCINHITPARQGKARQGKIEAGKGARETDTLHVTDPPALPARKTRRGP